MNIYDFNTKYATEWMERKGSKISFFPFSVEQKGAMFTTVPGYPTIGGEFILREFYDDLYVSFGGKEYLFCGTPTGFDLLIGKDIIHSFSPATN